MEALDILFLDVMMPGISGIEVAREIRKFDENVKIIFLTSALEFAVESYAVKAYGYLLKPAVREGFFPVLDKLLFSVGDHINCLTVKSKEGIVKILFDKLSYVEVQGKNLFFHLSDGIVYEAAGALVEYENTLLRRPEFYRVHRSFVVNLWQMQELQVQKFVSFYGDHVPVSRRLYHQVRDAYVKSLFSKAEVG